MGCSIIRFGSDKGQSQTPGIIQSRCCSVGWPGNTWNAKILCGHFSCPPGRRPGNIETNR